jgi:hypothetical protein
LLDPPNGKDNARRSCDNRGAAFISIEDADLIALEEKLVRQRQNPIAMRHVSR